VRVPPSFEGTLRAVPDITSTGKPNPNLSSTSLLGTGIYTPSVDSTVPPPPRMPARAPEARAAENLRGKRNHPGRRSCFGEMREFERVGVAALCRRHMDGRRRIKGWRKIKLLGCKWAGCWVGTGL
jgi:hypothetical protein